MSTSQTFSLSKPIAGEAIRVPTLAYFRSRHKQKLHSLILTEFEKSEITQAELCRRLRKEPAQISRMLGSPSNLRLDTVSDLLFAISGAEPVYQVTYPLEKAARNFRAPDWITEAPKRKPTSDTTETNLFDEKPRPFEILRSDARAVA